MNHLAIELNNLAIQEFKRGDLLASFGLFSRAALVISETTTRHKDHHRDIDDTDQEVSYQFFWEDSSETMASKILPTSLVSGNIVEMSPFLYVKFLRISIPAEDGVLVDSICPCGFSWVILYK